MRINISICAVCNDHWTPKTKFESQLEAEAILVVISLIESGDVELISSESLLFEVARNPNQTRREYVLEVLRKTREFVELNEEIEKRAREFLTFGIKALDALHLASAEQVKADYFCTCDDKFLKKAKSIKVLKTTAVSPIQLIDEIEK